MVNGKWKDIIEETDNREPSKQRRQEGKKSITGKIFDTNREQNEIWAQQDDACS